LIFFSFSGKRGSKWTDLFLKIAHPRKFLPLSKKAEFIKITTSINYISFGQCAILSIPPSHINAVLESDDDMERLQYSHEGREKSVVTSG